MNVAHTQTQGFDDLSWERPPPLAPVPLNLWKDTVVRKWEQQLEIGRAEMHVHDATALSSGPHVNKPITNISQFTGFDELLQPVHHFDSEESALSDCTVRQWQQSWRHSKNEHDCDQFLSHAHLWSRVCSTLDWFWHGVDEFCRKNKRKCFLHNR